MNNAVFCNKEWNKNYSLFLNKHELIEKTENLEKYFRRLVSSNNEVAMESFIQLTVGAPAEVWLVSAHGFRIVNSEY